MLLLLECLLNVGNIVLHSGIGGIKLRGLLVCFKGAIEVTLAVQGGAFPAPALGPVGFELGGLVGIFQCVFVVSLGGVCGGSVAVEDVVVWCQGNSLRKLVTVPKESVLEFP